MEPQTQVTFGDVAGLTSLELNEVVDFLKNADRFTAVGQNLRCAAGGATGNW